METFEDLQIGIIEIILDYHREKTVQNGHSSAEVEEEEDALLDSDTTSRPTSSWVSISETLLTKQTAKTLLKSADRDTQLSTLIDEATQRTTTRKPLLQSLLPILVTLDSAKNIIHRDLPSTYIPIMREMTHQLLTLQAENPSSGTAKKALDKFFTSVRDIHETLMLCLNEQTKTKYEDIVSTKEQEFLQLQRYNEELQTRVNALKQVIDAHTSVGPSAVISKMPATETAAQARISSPDTRGAGFTHFWTSFLSIGPIRPPNHPLYDEGSEYVPFGHDMY